MTAQPGTARAASPLLFIALVLVLSVPFWVVGTHYSVELLPGLPLAAIAVVCPLIAASILVRRERGSAGVKAHLQRSFDWRRIAPPIWYLPILLLCPAVAVLSYAVMRLLDWPVPAPQISWTAAVMLSALFFISALGEESGWSGYLIDPLQERFGAVPASIVLGLVWAGWHLVPLLQAGRAPDWIAWWCLGTVSLRVLHTWLYNNTCKSVFGAILFHATNNVSWQLFPNSGSHYDPRINGLIVSAVAVLVALRWGAHTLTGEKSR
jgi:membrane protease YdiL (CAAX protease family)